MKKMLFLLAAAATFGATPYASRLGVVFGSLLLLTLAIALASAASGGLNALAIAAGGLGAFGSGVLAPTSSAVAGACLVGLAFAERTMRVRSPTARLVHLGVALVGGALAGTLSSAYATALPAVRGVAIVVAAVLIALPLLVDADDPIAHALDTTSTLLRDPARAALRQGAELRRNAEEALLDAETARGVRKTWRSLLKLAEARLRLERVRAGRAMGPRVDGSPAAPSPADAVVNMVDQKIAEHVAALSRAYTALDTAHAAEIGLDDSAARSVDAAGETLEDVSRALVEIKN